MARRIAKVAVIGAGTMGSGIACHVANAGLPCVLLDIVPPKLSAEERKVKANRDRFAASAMQRAEKAKKPPELPLFTKRFASRVTTGNLEDDLGLLEDCDLIVEAVLEDLQVKRDLFDKVAKHRKPGAIVATNTSGLGIAPIVKGFDEEFRQHFLVMHFFNPPRFMRLLEIVKGEDTLPEVVEAAAEFGEKELGKGIVYAKDTPNFIANRIGVAGIARTFQLMVEHGLTVEQVDLITGPAMGRPKSATFGTTDLVGLDVLDHIFRNTYQALPNDKARELLKAPEWFAKMVSAGQLGKKSKKGFYTRDGATKLFWDYTKGEYKPVEKPKFDSIKAAKDAKGGPGAKIKALVAGEDGAARFAWAQLSDAFLYVGDIHDEIADDIVNVDNAMKWGFNWDLGPFEVWDAVGVKDSVERLRKEGHQIPAIAIDVLEKGEGSFYVEREHRRYFWDHKAKSYQPVRVKETEIDLGYLKATGRSLADNDSASLVDLGDGVLCLEFHSKMNAIDDELMRLALEGLDRVESSPDHVGLVLGNQGTNFSVGANIFMILMLARQKQFDQIDMAVRALQQVNTRMKYLEKPVVAAPFQMALGGGCEVCLAADAICAHAELYMGLVELGVGVIPAGCGTTNLLSRWLEHIPPDLTIDRFPYIQKAFELIGMANVSFSAEQARDAKFLRASDRVVMDRDALLHEAKKMVVGMAAAGYKPPREPDWLILPGREGLATFKMGLHNMLLGGFITEYEQFMATKLANIMCGGDIEPYTRVSEQNLLDLERETFLSLCGEAKTQERMQSILMTNKPLRN